MTDYTRRPEDDPRRGLVEDDRPRVVEDDAAPPADDPRVGQPVSTDDPNGARRAVRRYDDDTTTTTTAAAAPVPVVATTDAADRLGGVRWGAVFFGWLAAMGVAVILVAVIAATGTALGLTDQTVGQLEGDAAANAGAVGIGGAVALAVVLGLAYLAGGYVAARMSRYSGRSQGFAVWLLGLVVTIVGALAALLLGSAYDVLARLDLPRIPVDQGTATTGGIITLVVVLLVTLGAAVLGGALGDRYHRRMDVLEGARYV